MSRLFTCVAALLFAGAAAAQPAYKIEASDYQKVSATITYELETTNFAASKWMIFVAEPPELPSQRRVTTTASPAGRVVAERSLLARQVRYIEIPVARPKPGGGVTTTLGVEAVLRKRELVELKDGELPLFVAPLPARERKYYLSSTTSIDHDAKAFGDWLDAKKLRAERGESPIDLAARVLDVIRADYKYHFAPDDDKRASVVCGRDSADCGGMSYLFVGAMRANDIPARLLVGRYARPREPGSTPAQTGYDRPHVRAEMFVNGVGWVPVDPAVAHGARRRPAAAFVGRDPGDMLVLHVDVDLKLPFPTQVREAQFLQIGPCYWTAGTGKFDGRPGPTGWEVTTKLIEKK